MFEAPARRNPERNLWLEVLYRTVEDATKGPRHVPKPADKALIMREARDYLTRPSRDLAMVCALAGVDMGAVIARMRENLSKDLRSERPRAKIVDSRKI
ncbi:hypothetical protein H9N28_09465 [Rhodobacter capsulatus]|uniref:hypothetical protein n=1 Tax=Rhodobacter capsulatus TaxID=1061 RepID=UPI0006DCF2A3|nr:hypothetical protein [Rhodobacter capsulatus]KQB12761.1 hypothetical protein AP073_06610 [Rhodobacter capsulatus]KQB15365.1 hypothetical protein AP071_14520 [Rhodobacter capsulatus]PZX26354.1 hypothetical protein LY44_01048 [Rhodobacter capsulatus]QNR61844.1 hypothetical protein H9N28_09465 [Rhodobacter capsulatus]